MNVINHPYTPKQQLWPTANPPRAANGMYAMFMAFGIIGGFLALLFTPQILIAPTILIGGLLFFGLGAIIDRLGVIANANLPQPAPATAPSPATILDSTMRSESAMNKAAKKKTGWMGATDHA